MPLPMQSTEPVRKQYPNGPQAQPRTGPVRLSDLVVFKDASLAAKYEREPMPMNVLYEAYFDGALDIPGDIYELFAHRYEVTSHAVVNPEHLKFFFTRLLGEITVHTKAFDTNLVRDHYDRGNDFFHAFLGERMVYTSGIFSSPNMTLEESQDEKIDRVCQKLALQSGESLLDIGCGWGTLVSRAAKKFGAHTTGVTLAQNQASFGNERAKEYGVEKTARVLCQDYREIEQRTYDKIVSLEMVEHVGVRNLGKYFGKVKDLLADDGLFLLQWTGCRRNPTAEDIVWYLFMGKYVFPGADASLPLGQMLGFAERAGFEIQSVENISDHYRRTIKLWHDNWLASRETITKNYGERWFRIWHFFLAWSVVIAGQGTAACFQVVMNKNTNSFDRAQFVDRPMKRSRTSS